MHTITLREQSTKESIFIFASTTFHLVLATALAFSHDACNVHLYIVQQKSPMITSLLDFLAIVDKPPFSRITILNTREGTLLEKFSEIKESIQSIIADTQKYRPKKIFTGNDRDPEFQAAAYSARKNNFLTTCAYYDDGLGSFITLRKNSLKSFFKNLYNKIIYGYWVVYPLLLGNSEHIRQVYTLQPQLLSGHLKKKDVHAIDAGFFRSEYFREFSRYFLLSKKVDADVVKSAHYIVMISDKFFRERIEKHEENIIEIISSLAGAGCVCVKYHPREREHDALNLQKIANVKIIPREVPYEFLLPFMGNPVVVGDLSGIIMTTKLFRPDLEVISIQIGNLYKVQEFSQLCDQLRIRSVRRMEELKELLPGR